MATRSASALSALPAASQCRVAVCGAGVAGALTARRLAEAGMSVTCFEAGRGPGGRTSSRRTDLGHFDHGASYFAPKTEAFAAKSLREKMADLPGTLGVAAQVFLDQCVHHPFMYFPAFYMTKELVLYGGDASVDRVYKRWNDNFWPDLEALWKIWVPATCLNFAFSPMWMRIPVVASTSLVWTMILSAMRGTEEVEDGAAAFVGEEEDAAGLVMLGPHVSARTMEVFAQGLARRHSLPEMADVASAVTRRLSRSDTPAEEGLPKPRPKAQDVAHLCVTASGKDRVGLVSMLSQWIYERGGNITGSKMLRMNDEFTVILHVTSKDRVAASHLRADLLGREGANKQMEDLTISARELRVHGSHADADSTVREARVRLTGADQPGIVFKVSKLFSEVGFNIEELATDTVAVANEDGKTRPFFLLEGYLTAPKVVPPAELEKKLEQAQASNAITVPQQAVTRTQQGDHLPTSRRALAPSFALRTR
mgnify:CR=1 FL=1